MNIVLTGFMGSGKTITGRRLAKLLKLAFVDVDAEIERERGAISAIFEREGEARFRRYETEMIERLTSGGTAVIAVGGGAVLSAANRALLRRNGFIVHLQVTAAQAYRRVAHRRHRPLLGEAPDPKRIRALLDERRVAYADNDLSLATDGRTALEVARAIARWYRGKTNAPANVRGRARD